MLPKIMLVDENRNCLLMQSARDSRQQKFNFDEQNMHAKTQAHTHIKKTSFLCFYCLICI